MPSQAKSKSCSGYTSAATHRSATSKSSLAFTITMPASGTVTVSGVVVTSRTSYHSPASVSISVQAARTDCLGA
mgnify:FL=1